MKTNLKHSSLTPLGKVQPRATMAPFGYMLWLLVLFCGGLSLVAKADIAYIANAGSNNVSVIDTNTNSVVTTVPVGTNPYGVAVNPAGTRVYVTNIVSSDVSVIDTSTDSVVATVAAGGPIGVVVNPAGTRVYVANAGSDNVIVIDTSNNSVVTTVPVGTYPFGIVVNPAGTRVYVANRNSNDVSVIDTSNNSVVATVAVSGPLGVAVNPTGTRVYVGDDVNGAVNVIDTSNNSVVATVTVGTNPYGVAVNPAGTRVYVANRTSNNVSVIDTSNNSVVATVTGGSLPIGVAVNQTGTRVYVANVGGNNVTVIDTSNNTVVATVVVGTNPWSLGQFIRPVTDCNIVTEIPVAECQELLSLYNNTGGLNWRHNTGWNLTHAPCSWYGVSCQGGHVTEISLPNNSLLTGPLSTLNLPSLQYLNLSNNQLTGEVPPSITSLPLSVGLNIECNQLTATNPTVIAFLKSHNPDWNRCQLSFLSSPPITAINAGENYNYTIVAQGKAPLTITAPTKRPWLTLTDYNNNTALLTGPTTNQVGTHPVVLQIKDSLNQTATQSFDINVFTTGQQTSNTYQLTINLKQAVVLINGQVEVMGQLFSSSGSTASRPITLTLTAPDKTIQTVTATTNGIGEYNQALTKLNQVGTYSLEASFEDSNTLLSPDAAKAQQFSVQETGISLILTTPTDQTTLKAEDGVVIKGTASDNNNGAWIQKVTVSLQDLGITDSTATEIPPVKLSDLSVVGTSHWLAETHEVQLIPGHDYRLTAKAIDLAGNPSTEQTVQFSVAPIEFKTTLSLSAAKTQLVTPEETVTVTTQLTITPPTTVQSLSERPIKLTVTRPNNAVDTYPGATDDQGKVTFPLTGLVELGNYRLQAQFDATPTLPLATADLVITKTGPVGPVDTSLQIFYPEDKSTLNNLPHIAGVVFDPLVQTVQVAIQDDITKKYLQLNHGEESKTTAQEAWLPASGTKSWQLNTNKIEVLLKDKRTYLVTARALDTSGVVLNTAQVRFTYQIDPDKQAFTSLALELGSATILNGDSVNVAGKLTHYQKKTRDLSNLPIELTILQPDGTTKTFRTYTDTNTGQYQLSGLTGFDQQGAYIFYATFDGTPELVDAQAEPQTLLVGQSAGYAILVQGKIANEEGLQAHYKTLNRIYKKLKERGLKEENIYYFNYSPQKAGHDGVPSKNAIINAFTELNTRLNGSPAPLYVVMVDHGGIDGSFHVGSQETMTPSELNTWLTDFETGLTDQALATPRIIMLGACYSGQFIAPLSKVGRIIITSAAENEVSYKGPIEIEDGIRGGELFMEEFFQFLGRGKSFNQSFEKAAEKIRVYTRKGDTSSNALKQFADGAVQHPLLDDNGDHKGSNLLTMDFNQGDGTQAERFYLGAGPNYQTNYVGNPADILTVPETIYLDSDQTTANFIISVNNADRVKSAPVDIRPPSITLPVDGREHTEQLQINNLTRVFLSCNNQTQLCHSQTNQFTEAGKYEAFYFVRDAYNDNISELKHSVVYKNYAGNAPPAPFNLTAPADHSSLPTTLILDWERTTDPENHPVTYTLLVAEDQAMTKLAYTEEEIRLSMLLLDHKTMVKSWQGNTWQWQSGLKDNFTYYWQVIAVDSFGARAVSSQTFQFTTDNPNADYGCAHLTVRDDLFSLPLEARVEIVGGDSSEPSVIPGELGDYLMCLPTGSYQVTPTKDGYKPIPQLIEIKQDGANTYGLTMFLDPIPFSPGHIQFSDDGSTFGEEEANKQIYAYRVGGKDGPVSVDYKYTLSDGTVITGTLFWADQDAQPKPIPIPVDDNTVSGTDYKFEITLSNAQGGAILENAQHPVTIVDNDSPKPGMVQFVDELIEVNLEGQSTERLQVERVGGTAGKIEVNYVVTSPDGAQVAKGTVIWDDNDSTPKEITVLAEKLPPEGSLLQVTLIDNNLLDTMVLGDLKDAVVTQNLIIIPPADCTNRVQFETAAMPVKEDSGTVTFNVTLTRSGTSTCDVSVKYLVAASTSNPDQDYNFSAGSLTWIAADSQPKSLSLTILDDNIYEPQPEETIILQLVNPVNSTLGEMRELIMTIEDNDPSPRIETGTAQFESAFYPAKETDATVTLTATRINGTQGELSVRYVIVSGTAKPDTDYRANPAEGVLTWADGDAGPKTITLDIINDDRPEEEETLTVQLQTAGVPAIAKVTIKDDDEYAYLQFSQPEYHLPADALKIVVPIRRTGNEKIDVSAACKGNVGSEENFLVFAAGNSERNCVLLLSDKQLTPGEKITLTLSNFYDAKAGSPSTATVIIDDVCTPRFLQPNTIISEDANELTLNVSCEGGSADQTLTVSYSTEDGTAQAGQDYQSQTGNLTFSKETGWTQTLTIPIVNDTLKEDNETFSVKLLNADKIELAVESIITTITEFPTLDPAVAKGTDGQAVTTETSIRGGVAVNGEEYRSQVVVSLSDTVDVAGEITVAESDLGQPAEVVVFAGYRSSLDNPAEIFFMLNSEINILPWDEDVAKLVAYQPATKLEKTLPVSLYQGQFVASGHLNLYFGYRLRETGAVVYNAVPLEVDIQE